MGENSSESTNAMHLRGQCFLMTDDNLIGEKKTYNWSHTFESLSNHIMKQYNNIFEPAHHNLVLIVSASSRGSVETTQQSLQSSAPCICKV